MKVFIIFISFTLLVFPFSLIKDFFGLGNSGFHNSRGLLQLNKSKFKKALKQFKFAYKKETGSWQKKVLYLRNISLAYIGLDDLESVGYYYQEILNQCEEESYDFYITKGDLSCFNDNVEDAIKYFEKAISIDSNKLEANNSLGVIYLGNCGEEYIDPEQALVYNKRAIVSYPYSITKAVLGENHFMLGDFHNAQKYLSQACNENLNNPDSNFLLKITKYKLGNYKSAKKGLAKLLKTYPYLMEKNEEIEKILLDLEIEL